MKPQTFKLNNASFGKQEIIGEIIWAKKPDTVVIFFHGCCSGPFSSRPTKYQLLAQRLAEQGLAAGAYYQSSRKLYGDDFSEEVSFEQRAQLAFGGKTLEDEYRDGVLAVQEIVESVQKKIGAKPKLVFVGFSLGGLVATLVSQDISPDILLTFGSGIGFNLDPETPILGGGISVQWQKKIRKAAQSFSGKVVINRGTEDVTTPKETTLDLFESFTQAEQSSFQEWSGVDHRFATRSGHDAEAELLEELFVVLSKTHFQQLW